MPLRRQYNPKPQIPGIQNGRLLQSLILQVIRDQREMGKVRVDGFACSFESSLSLFVLYDTRAHTHGYDMNVQYAQ